jgi:hypothetical protein
MGWERVIQEIEPGPYSYSGVQLWLPRNGEFQTAPGEVLTRDDRQNACGQQICENHAFSPRRIHLHGPALGSKGIPLLTAGCWAFPDFVKTLDVPHLGGPDREGDRDPQPLVNLRQNGVMCDANADPLTLAATSGGRRGPRRAHLRHPRPSNQSPRHERRSATASRPRTRPTLRRGSAPATSEHTIGLGLACPSSRWSLKFANRVQPRSTLGAERL